VSTYRQRREARAERLREWAEKREGKADAAAEAADRMASVIPFGQPTLVGHHSERRDRNYRARIAGEMDYAVEHWRKADSMTRRADGIEAQLDASIYDDDSDATEQLERRIAGLEAARARLVAFNKTARKGCPDFDLLTDGLGESWQSLSQLEMLRNRGFPAYATSNLSSRISKDRDRLARLLRRREA
jgi:hypothetical protein